MERDDAADLCAAAAQFDGGRPRQAPDLDGVGHLKLKLPSVLSLPISQDGAAYLCSFEATGSAPTNRQNPVHRTPHSYPA